MKFRVSLLIAIVIVTTLQSLAQTASFAIPHESNLCLNESIKITNTSAGVSDFQWDFCAGDLMTTPTVGAVANTGVGEMRCIRTVHDGTDWVSFAISKSGNQLFRLKHGTSLDNTPEIENWGNVGGLLNQASSFKLLHENGIWYAIVHNGGNNKLLRLTFTAGLLEAPTAEELLSGVGGEYSSLDLEVDGDSIVAVIANYFGNNFITVNFGESILNNPTSAEVKTGPVVTDFVDVDVVENCEKWYGFALSWDGKTLYRLDFDNGNRDLFSIPAVTALHTFSSRQSKVQYIEEAGTHFLWVASESGNVNQLTLDGTLTASVDEITELGDFGVLSNNWGLSLNKDNGNWYGMVLGLAGSVNKLVFSAPCAANNPISTDQHPVVHYTSAGNYVISLTGKTTDGCTINVQDTITIGSTSAPVLEFTIDENRCIENENTFTITEPGSINNFEWDFGDGSTIATTDAQVIHSYAAASSYVVSLSTDVTIGCNNYAEKTITIYNAPPTPDFTWTPSIVCTHTEVDFQNETDESAHPGNVLQYTWDFNGEGNATTAEPSFVFDSIGTKAITLVAKIPGCENEVTKNIAVAEGNAVEMSFLHNCFGETVEFNSGITGPGVVSLNWDFDDGALSTDANPSHQFVAPGAYDVKLYVTNTLGCTTEVMRTLNVNDQPLADFTSDPAVENVPVGFAPIDLSLEGDSITQWNWFIEDSLFSTEMNAVHAFASPGSYSIKLSVTTAQQCTFDTIKVLPVALALFPSMYVEIPAEVCLNENIFPVNRSLNAVSYEWDFCAGDLEQIPVLRKLVGSGVTGVRNLVVENDNGVWYGFMIGKDNGTLYRISFGATLLNAEPVIEPVDVAGILNSVLGFKIIREDGKWYGLAHNGGSGNLVRLTFEGGLGGAVSAQEILIGVNVGSDYSNLDVERDGEDWVVVISNYAAKNFVIVNFVKTILDNPTAVAVKSTPIVPDHDFGDVDIINHEGTWIGYAVSWDGKSLFRLDFDNDSLFTVPAVVSLSHTFPERPARVRYVYEGGAHLLFVSTESGNLYRITLDKADGSITSSENLGNFGELNNSLAFTLKRERSRWLGYVMSLTGDFHELSFPEPCGLSEPYSEEPNPAVVYTTPGNFKISVTGLSVYGNSAQVTTDVSVSPDVAPDVELAIIENFCVDAANKFSAESDNAIVDYLWDFGDGNSANVAAPVHQYNQPGAYTVNLRVTGENGCANHGQKVLKLYEAPKANFELPFDNDEACTSQIYTYKNTTLYDEESDAQWYWTIDGVSQSADKDLNVAFPALGEYVITLKASLSMCTSEKTKLMKVTHEGIEVEFSNTAPCEGDSILFKRESTGGTNYEWRFSDGTTKQGNEAYFVFQISGSYEVTLVNTDESECNNYRTKQIEVFTKPVVDFSFSDLTFYCTNTPMLFKSLATNAEDGLIEELLWTIGPDENRAGDQFEFIFEESGTFDVSLTAINSNGCQTTRSKEMTVLQSPSSQFEIGTACVGVPYKFTPPSDESIVSWDWSVDEKNYETKSPEHIFRTAGEHPVMLSVVALNGCSAGFTRDAIVPEPLEPMFSITNNCVGEPTILTDTTTGVDPVITWNWTIDESESYTGNPLELVFNQEEEKSVKLMVTGQSGCTYVAFETFHVVAAPQASFTVSSMIGTPPFPITVTNTSTNATKYLWSFGDGQTSEEVSPAHTYLTEGEFDLSLTATNEAGCIDQSSKTITITAPHPDVTIMAITKEKNPDGSLKITVVLQNDGNTIIENLPVVIDVSGNLSLQEVVEGQFMPLSRVYLELGYGLNLRTDLTFLCAEANLANDVTPLSNRNCIEFDGQFIMMPVYPNPVKDVLDMQWIGTSEQTIRVALYNAFGNEVWSRYFDSHEGLNQHALTVDGFYKGVYMLVLESPDFKATQRVLLTR